MGGWDTKSRVSIKSGMQMLIKAKNKKKDESEYSDDYNSFSMMDITTTNPIFEKMTKSNEGSKKKNINSEIGDGYEVINA